MRRLILLLTALALTLAPEGSSEAKTITPAQSIACPKHQNKPTLTLLPQREAPRKLIVIGCNFDPGMDVVVSTNVTFADGQPGEGRSQIVLADKDGSFRKIVRIEKHEHCTGPEFGVLISRSRTEVIAQSTTGGQDWETGEYRGPKARATLDGIPVGEPSEKAECERDRVTKTFRIKLLGHAAPGEAFVATYEQFLGGRLPGLKSPPRGGGWGLSTLIVLCGSVSKRDFEKYSSVSGYPVRQMLGNGERECQGKGSVFTRSVTVAREDSADSRFLRVADHEPEFLVQKEGVREENQTAQTRIAYYDFRIGAGRVGRPPRLADRRFHADVSIELRGRPNQNIWGQEFIGSDSWSPVCFEPGYKTSNRGYHPPEGWPRCSGGYRVEIDNGHEGLRPGTRLTYSLITAGARDAGYAPSYSGCSPGPRKLVCVGTRLDSDVSIRLWYDFDKLKGGSRVVKIPYTVPTGMPRTGAGGTAGSR